MSSSADPKVIVALVSEVNAAATVCTDPDLTAAITTNARALSECVPDDNKILEGALKLHSSAMKPQIDRLLNARQAEAGVSQAVAQVRSTKNQVLTGATTLSRHVNKAVRKTWDERLVRTLIVTRPNPDLSWNKVQSHSVVIKADSPYLKDVALALGTEQKYDYRIESATGRILGYSIGVIYTPLNESTWTAVGVPGTRKS